MTTHRPKVFFTASLHKQRFENSLPPCRSKCWRWIANLGAAVTVLAFIVSLSVPGSIAAHAADEDTLEMTTSPTVANIQSFISGNDRVGRTLKITLGSDLVIASTYSRKRVQSSSSNNYGTIFGNMAAGVSDGTGWGAVLGNLEIDANGYTITNNAPLSYLTKLGRSGGSFTFYNGTYDGGGVSGLVATLDSPMRDRSDAAGENPSIGQEPTVIIGREGFDTTVKNSNFAGAISGNSGQAVAIRTGSLEVTGARFEHNSTVAANGDLAGGAIGINLVDARKNQHTTITDSSFVDNSVHSNAQSLGVSAGGAIGVRATTSQSIETVTITRTRFSGNTASAQSGIAAGGAIAINPNSSNGIAAILLNVNGSTFTGNEARMFGAGGSFGGAIATARGRASTNTKLIDSAFVGNKSIVLSEQNGSDTAAEAPVDPTLQNSTARGGSFDLENVNGSASIRNSTFTANSAVNPFYPENGSGGAIGVTQALLPNINVQQATFLGNTASGAVNSEPLPNTSAAWPKNSMQSVYLTNIDGESTTDNVGPENGRLYNNWDIAYIAEGPSIFGNTGAATQKAHSADVVMLLPADKTDAYGYTAEDLASVVQDAGEFWMQATYGAISGFSVKNSIIAVSTHTRCETDQDGNYLYVDNAVSDAAKAVAPGRTKGYYSDSTKSTHLVIFIDAAAGCGGSTIGTAIVNGLHGGGWVRENMALAGNQKDAQSMLSGVIHEMGHNVGLYHSMARKCTAPYYDGLLTSGVAPSDPAGSSSRYWSDPSQNAASPSNAIDGACNDIAYGDIWSALGGQRPSTLAGGSFVGPTVLQQYSSGWLPADAVTDVSLAGGVSQTFALNAAGLNQGLVGLNVTSPVANGDKRYNFMVEYRNETGIDAKSLISSLPVMNGNGGGYVTDGVRVIKTNGSGLTGRQTVVIQGRHADGAQYAAMRPGDSLVPLGDAVRVTPVSPVMGKYDRSTQVRIDFRAFNSPKSLNIAVSSPSADESIVDSGEETALPPAVGDTLSAELSGEWGVNFGGVPEMITESHQWYRGEEPIAGATEAHYTLTPEDLDSTISLRVTPSASAGWATTPEAIAVSNPLYVPAPEDTEADPTPDLEEPSLGCQPLDNSTATSIVSIGGIASAQNYGDGPFTLTLSGAEGADEVSFTSSNPSVARISGDQIKIMRAGKVCLTGTVAADASHAAATAQLEVTIARAETSISLSATGGQSPGDTIELTAQVTKAEGATHPLSAGAVQFYDGETELGKSNSASNSGISALKIPKAVRGTHEFRAVYSGTKEHYLPATSTTVELIVKGAPQPDFAIIAPSAADTVYGNAPFALTTAGRLSTASVVWSVPVDNGIISLDPKTGTVTILAAGTVTVSARVPGDQSFDDASATFDLTIAKRAVTITAESHSLMFGEPLPALGWTADPPLFGSDSLAGSLAVANSLLPGEYSIVEAEPFSNPNYEITFVPGVLSIVLNDAQQAVVAAIERLPHPVRTIGDANAVAHATTALAKLSAEERAALSENAIQRLSEAQKEAGRVNHFNPELGVTAFANSLPWNVRLNATEATGGGRKNFEEKLATGRSLIVLYDLHFIDTLDGDSWQPASGEPVEIELSKVQLLGYQDVQVQHRHGAEQIDVVPVRIANSRVRFEGSSFSLYGVSGVALSTGARGELSNTGTKEPLELPLSVSLALAAGVGALMLARGRRTRSGESS